MYVTRNAVMDALLNLLKTMKGFNGFSRRFSMYDKLSGSAAMPYLMLCKPKEIYPPRQISALPAKRTFYVEVIIYISDGKNQASVPDTVVNDIMDKLDEVLRPIPPLQTQTLGGLVDHCYIAGDITLVPGDVDGIGQMLIPLEIVVP